MGTIHLMAPSDGLEGLHSPRISGSTRILGVFGYPVEHSLSPAMHNAAIAALGLSYIYTPFSVRPEDLGPAIRSLAPLGIVGVNLTIPHKERVLPFLDVIAPEAHTVGAVNTVHNSGGRLLGYNTDGDGFIAPLLADSVALHGRHTVVLGAGGSARPVAHRLAREGARITLVNRTEKRASRLAADVNETVGTPVAEALPYGATAAERVASAELLVNCTSIGMSPHVGEMPPLPCESFHPGLLVYDLIYSPLETRLLAAARAAGARTMNGVRMLVHQGAAAFHIWTGVEPPVDVMERSVLQGLAEREAGSGAGSPPRRE